MKLGPAALGAACAAFVAPQLAAAELPLNGIGLGNSVRTLAQTLGPPAEVLSDDVGNRFVFPGGTAAYADDDGIVLAVDVQTGSPRVDVEGAVRAFPIGSYSAASADADLADIAEFTTPTVRSYRLAPRRDLVLSFNQSTRRLERVIYGEPGQLARLGLLPGDGAAKAVVYRAPRLRGTPRDPARETPRSSGDHLTVFRLEIDRSGTVRSVDVVVPSTVPDSDAEAGRQLLGGRYTPATLDGRPIGATIFIQVSH